jgi:putative hydrolase of the HAD superfamily
MLRNIIFDLGGVCLNRGAEIAFREKFAGMFSLPLEEGRPVPVFWEHLYPSGFITGRISEDEYWRLCGRDLGKRIDARMLRTTLLETFEENGDVIRLVRDLKGRYRLGLLTNMPGSWADWLDSRFRLFRNFDAVAVSGHEGFVKPEPEIYEIMLRRLGAEPRECVFIDDQEANLRYPARAGMEAVLFQSPGQLRSELDRLGIRTP